MPDAPRRHFIREEYTRPIWRQELTFHTAAANHVYKRCYLHVSKALYTLDVICANVLDDHQVEEIDKTVTGILGDLRNELAKEVARLDQIAKEYGNIRVPDAFDTTWHHVAEYSTGLMLGYFEILALLEEVAKKTYAMQGSRMYKTKNCAARIIQWRQRVIRQSNVIINLGNQFWSGLRERHTKQDDTKAHAAKETVAILEPVVGTGQIAEVPETEETPSTEALAAAAALPAQDPAAAPVKVRTARAKQPAAASA